MRFLRLRIARFQPGEQPPTLHMRTPDPTDEILLLPNLQTGRSSERHADEPPITCSHDLLHRSCSSYHASGMRAPLVQSVLPATRSSQSRPSATTTGGDKPRAERVLFCSRTHDSSGWHALIVVKGLTSQTQHVRLVMLNICRSPVV